MNGCDVRNFRVLVFNSSILALLVLFVLLIHAAFSNASASPPVASTAPPLFFLLLLWCDGWLDGCVADRWVVVSCWWVVDGGGGCRQRYGPKLLMQYLVLDLCVRKSTTPTLTYRQIGHPKLACNL